jgi:hypothetical protein
MGKPMGNGLPIAGIVARREVVEDFGRQARYFNTFGGNPVCVAAASAVLDVLADEDLPGNAAATGGYLKDSITDLAANSPVLGDDPPAAAVRTRARRPVHQRPRGRSRGPAPARLLAAGRLAVPGEL